MSQVNSTSQLEDVLHRESQDLDQVLADFQETLTGNISSSINTARAHSRAVFLSNNESRTTLTTITNFLWFSVYIINADVMPRSNESVLLLSELRETARNFTAVAQQRIMTYAPVLVDVDQLFNASNFIVTQSSVLANNTSLDVNITLIDTQSELSEFDKALSAQILLSGTLCNQSLEMAIFSNDLLARIANSSVRIITLLRVANTTEDLVKDLATSNTTLHEDIVALQSRFSIVQQSYTNVFNISKTFLDHSVVIMQKANSTVAVSEQMYQRVQEIHKRMTNASLLANHTFNTAQKMYGVLSDYQTAITNSTNSLKNSLEQLNKVHINLLLLFSTTRLR